MANGNNNNGGAHSQMDSLIQMNDLMELMKEKYGSDWEGMVSGSLHSPSQPMVLSNELKKSLFDFSGKKNQYTTTAAFPLQVFIDEWSKLNPGYESKDTQFYSGTGTGSTEEDALQNARMVAQLSAMYNPESSMGTSDIPDFERRLKGSSTYKPPMKVNSPLMELLQKIIPGGKTGY